MDPPDNTTELLREVSAGDASAHDRLFPLVYDELRKLANHLFAQQRPGHTMQPTALVHEAYVHLIRGTGVTWQDRAHFIAIAAKAMRRILIDHARAQSADKRGGGWERIPLEASLRIGTDADIDFLAVNEALEELAMQDGRKARLVELRFFGGLSVEEAGHVLGISKSTAEGDWRFARAWLSRALE